MRHITFLRAALFTVCCLLIDSCERASLGRLHDHDSHATWVRGFRHHMGWRQAGTQAARVIRECSPFMQHAWWFTIFDCFTNVQFLVFSQGSDRKCFCLALVAADILPLLQSEGGVKSIMSYRTYMYRSMYVSSFLLHCT